MYRVAICDDEPYFRLKLIELIEKNISSKNIEIKEYGSGEDFLEDFYDDITFDLIFMDISMQGIDGDEVIKRVRATEKNHTLISFITSVVSDVSKIVELQPHAYIYKNNSDEYISSKIKEMFKILNEGQNVLEFTSNRRSYRVSCSDIKYIESLKNDIYITTTGNTYITRSFSISQLSAMISLNSFLQCCSSAIVNSEYVKSFDAKSIEMQDGKIFSIGRKYKEEIYKYIGL